MGARSESCPYNDHQGMWAVACDLTAQVTRCWPRVWGLWPRSQSWAQRLLIGEAANMAFPPAPARLAARRSALAHTRPSSAVQRGNDDQPGDG